MRLLPSSLLTALALPLLATSPAAAQDAADPAPPAPRLGRVGQYWLTTDAELGIAQERFPTDDDPYSNELESITAIDLRFAIDHVIADKTVIGGQFGLFSDVVAYTNAQDDATKGVTAGARVGRIIPLGSDGDLALVPRAGVDYLQTTYQSSEGGEITISSLRLDLSVPLLWQPAGQFFLGLAPTYQRELWAQYAMDAPVDKSWGLGIHGILGVYFSGPKDDGDGVTCVGCQ